MSCMHELVVTAGSFCLFARFDCAPPRQISSSYERIPDIRLRNRARCFADDIVYTPIYRQQYAAFTTYRKMRVFQRE